MSENNKFKIEMKSIETVKKFVDITSKCESEIDISTGKHTIDAKSIMGIFALDLSKPVTVTIHSKNEEEIKKFFEEIKELVVD